MGDKGFMALLNPAIALLFSLTFLVFWTRQRHRHYILAFAGAYCLLSLGFLNSYLVDFSQHVQRSIVSNGSYLAGTLLMAWGLCHRAGVQYPKAILGAFTATGAAGALWYAAVEPNIVGRLYSVNFAVGAMFIATALKIRQSKSTAIVDRLLFWVVMLTGVQFFIRTSVSLYFDAGMTAATYQQSFYWEILAFFVSLFSLLMALSIIAACAHDIMQQVHQSAERDPLTGLLNRLGFDRAIGQTLNPSKTVPASLLIIDADHFKSVNDQHGHPAGDDVLRELGGLVSDAASSNSVSARFGGEEFCILLPNANLASARLFAENLRTMVERHRFDALPASRKVTVSIGVAELQAGQNFDELYRAADHALYQAKDAGRNCVRAAAAYFKPASPALNTIRVAENH
ncbi:MAG: GGDEF domain-containing protein [Rhizobiaceae bacterium]